MCVYIYIYMYVCVCIYIYIYVCVCVWMCLVTESCPTLCNPTDCRLPGSSVHGDSPGKNTGVSCYALLQGIFLQPRDQTQVSHIAGEFITDWATRKAHVCIYIYLHM